MASLLMSARANCSSGCHRSDRSESAPSGTQHVDFLPQLSQLTCLGLRCCKTLQGQWTIPADALLASLVRCNGLIDLTLCCGFKSTHWSALFVKLTRIKKLSIGRGEIDTLRCFEVGPITESLQELILQGVDLPPSELCHLYGLRRLRSLHLDRCFSARLDGAMIDRLSPPSPRIPSLIQLTFSFQNADGKWDSRVRHGASFEWMQQRRML